MRNKTPFPITPTSGGVIKPANVVCRNTVISHYWTILTTRGISLFAERRFGKSSIIRKMDDNPPKEFVTIYRSTQGTKSIEDFVESLLAKAKEKKLLGKANADSAGKFWNTIADLFPEILNVKLGKLNHVWQKKMVYLIDTILKSNPDKVLVIFLDEFSLMLNAMNPEDAATIIGFLRDIVHDTFSKNLRFVYTGSISIDLILDKIRRAGHNLGDPLNHTERKRVQPFDEEQTAFFCKCLEMGCKIELDDFLRNHIHNITGGIPYFIDRIIEQIRFKPSITKATIDEALDFAVNDPNDKNNLKYYYDRIAEHYPDAELSYEILLVLCKEDKLSEKIIINSISGKIARQDRIIQDEVQRLWNDGYLKRVITNGQRFYSFENTIIKKWWTINKA